MLSKQLRHNIAVRDWNLWQMTALIDDSIRLIAKQGFGCIIKDYGTAYVDPTTFYKDSIAIVSSIPNKHLNRHYGLISEDYQKPIVKHLARKYLVNVTRDCERYKFVEFLQRLQDAHDEAFQEKYDQMKKFVSLCDSIKKDYKLWHS